MNDISLSFKKESNDYGPIKKKHQITIPKINTYNTGEGIHIQHITKINNGNHTTLSSFNNPSHVLVDIILDSNIIMDKLDVMVIW